MKREFKFRVGNKEMKMFHLCDKCKVWESIGDYLDKNSDDYQINQFTGFRDINGKNIYEGDIIDKKYKWVVVYEDGAFYANNIYSKAYLLSDILRKRRIAGSPIEVVGNIYENPELIILKK